MQLKCKLVHPEARLPVLGSAFAAGMDFFAVTREDNYDYAYVEYDTGVAVEIPHGFVGLCFPRSSISKTLNTLSNCVGVIDCDYRGTVKARFNKRQSLSGMKNEEYKVGDRVFQMLIVPVAIVEPIVATELSPTERGEGGFGSTGA